MPVTEVKKMQESLWTAQEAADYLSIRRSTLYDWSGRGLVPCIRLREGRRRDCLRFSKKDLESFVESRRTAVRRDSEDKSPEGSKHVIRKRHCGTPGEFPHARR